MRAATSLRFCAVTGRRSPTAFMAYAEVFTNDVLPAFARERGPLQCTTHNSHPMNTHRYQLTAASYNAAQPISSDVCRFVVSQRITGSAVGVTTRACLPYGVVR